MVAQMEKCILKEVSWKIKVKLSSPHKASRRQYRYNIVVADIEVDILDKVADKVADMVVLRWTWGPTWR